MATVETPGVLGTFHGSEEFPIEWQEGEKELFWIYDDLHMPQPGVADVLRHRRLVADVRPHVPALRHAVRVATGSPRRSTATSTPPRSRPTRRCAPRRPSTRRATSPRVPRDPEYAGADRRLPRLACCPHYAEQLPRLVAGPAAARDRAQLRLPRRHRLRRRVAASSWRSCSRTRSTSTTATGRSTGCSTSPSSRPRWTSTPAIAEVRGEADPALMGRLQSSSSRTATGTRSRTSGR